MYYRIGTSDNQGLWYTKDGIFTGLIHNKYSFCANSKLAMEYDPDIIGYISVADSLESLFLWFPKEDIIKLEKFGYGIEIYESDDVKFYEKFQHYIINQNTSKLIKRAFLS